MFLCLILSFTYTVCPDFDILINRVSTALSKGANPDLAIGATSLNFLLQQLHLFAICGTDQTKDHRFNRRSDRSRSERRNGLVHSGMECLLQNDFCKYTSR